MRSSAQTRTAPRTRRLPTVARASLPRSGRAAPDRGRPSGAHPRPAERCRRRCQSVSADVAPPEPHDRPRGGRPPDAYRRGELLGSLVRRGDRIVAGAATGHGKTTFGPRPSARSRRDPRSSTGRGRAGGARDRHGARAPHHPASPQGGRLDTARTSTTCERRMVFRWTATGSRSNNSRGDRRWRLRLVLADPLYKLHRGDSTTNGTPPTYAAVRPLARGLRVRTVPAA